MKVPRQETSLERFGGPILRGEEKDKRRKERGFLRKVKETGTIQSEDGRRQDWCCSIGGRTVQRYWGMLGRISFWSSFVMTDYLTQFSTPNNPSRVISIGRVTFRVRKVPFPNPK